jgi:septum site-determining protein MinC
MPAARPRIDLKSAQVGALQMALRTRDIDEWRALLQDAWGDLGGAFDGEALCLDVSELPAGAALDWSALLSTLRHWQLCPVAVAGSATLSEDERTQARAAGLALLDGVPASAGPGTVEPTEAPQAQALDPLPLPTPVAAMVIDRPLRSGQQVYARDADLIVLGLVSHGAEVIADGHIHVYGALRGRAIAGAKGRTDARIFAQSLEAELLAVAGTFRTSEKPLPAEVLAKPAQVRLDGERLVFEPLKF